MRMLSDKDNNCRSPEWKNLDQRLESYKQLHAPKISDNLKREKFLKAKTLTEAKKLRK